MANPTTNYGFVLPTATDLVTDLPADFDVALQGVDTRLKALQPGTTLGDLAYSSATANTNTRLGIGTTGQVLKVVGGVPAWAAISADTNDFVLINTTSFSAVSSQSVNDVFSATYDNYVIKFNTTTASGNPYIHLRMRVSGTDTITGYCKQNFQVDNTTTLGARTTTDTAFNFVGYIASGFNNAFDFNLQNPFPALRTSAVGIWMTGADGGPEVNLAAWGLNNATSYTGFTFITSTGNVTGSVSVYGYKK